MSTAQRIVDEARTWIDTPFVKQQRAKGLGVDCIGLVVGVATALGIPLEDRRDYPLRPNGMLKRELDRQLVRVIGLAAARPGDVLLMEFGDEPHHVAFLTEDSVIHAALKFRRVLEQPLDAELAARVRAVYRLPGLA